MFKSLTFISASLFILCLTVHSEAQMTVEELNAAVEQALLDAGAGQAPPATSTADVVRIPIVNQSPLTDEVELTSEVEVQINPTQVNFAPIPADYFDYAKYNELRNVRDYDSDRSKMIKVVSWYDNEFGFSKRMVDLANYWATK